MIPDNPDKSRLMIMTNIGKKSIIFYKDKCQ